MEHRIRIGRAQRAGSSPFCASQEKAQRAGSSPFCASQEKAQKTRESGFTLIELMIVMTIISILIAIAVPIYQKSILRAKESVLRNNLFTLRTMIDEYTVDKQHAPQTLDDLVTDGYLRQVPVDPITNTNQTWKTIMEDTPADSSQPPGIFDVKSGAEGNGLDGTPYSDW